MPKIHYTHPVTQLQACAMAGDVELTADIAQVTCLHCIALIGRRPRAGGREAFGEKKKVPLTLRIDPELKRQSERLQMNRSQLLEDAIVRELRKSLREKP